MPELAEPQVRLVQEYLVLRELLALRGQELVEPQVPQVLVSQELRVSPELAGLPEQLAPE